MRHLNWILLAAFVVLPGCGSRSGAPVPGTAGVLEAQEGLASYYAHAFHGKVSASGVPFDMNAMVAAHPSYPFGTMVRVTNLSNGRSVRVRIMDRGPADGPRAAGVVIDLSYRAARRLGFVRDGRTPVRVEVLGWGDDRRSSAR